MKYNKVLFVLFSVLLFTECRKKEEINNILFKEIEETVYKKNSKKIIITGTADDTLALRYFNLVSNAYLFGKPYKNIKSNIINDSIYMEVDSIFKPQSFNVHIFGDSSYYGTRIFLIPGDTISFKIKEKQIHFYGKNATFSNFFISLEKNTSLYRYNPYKGDIYDYKKKVKKIYDEKYLFLDEYIKNNKFSSINQINLIKDILKFEYLSSLISPRSIFVESDNWYISTSEGVLSAISNEFENQEQLFDQKKYLDDVTINDFQRPDLLKNSRMFKNTFDAFIRYYFASNDHLDYSSEAFLAQKKFIQQNFKDDLEYYAIARMIREYNVRGFGYSTENIGILKNVINEYDSIFSKKPSYKQNMDEIMESLDNFNFKLSDEALNLTKLVNPIGDTITLQQIFNKSPQKIKVVDFWASWCPPCIREIKKAKQFKNKLSNKDNVEWVYLSIDKDKEKWLKKTNELQEYLNTKHQYIIVGGKNSSLAKSLKVSGIPRYVIFNSQEQIVLDNAPQPSDSLIFKKIIHKIN